MKLYLDTNVYLDFFLDRRKDKHAFRIFKKAFGCKFQIIISDHIFKELIHYVEPGNVKMFFETLRPKIIKVSTEEQDIYMAKNIYTHYSDALHIMLAGKAGADYIITSNVKDYRGLFETKLPEDI